MTNRREKYTLYFQALIDELSEQHNFPNTHLVQGRHFHQFYSGTTDIYYVPGFRRRRSLSGFYHQGRQAFTVLGLWSNNRERNKVIFDVLKERESEIKARFGGELEWYRRNDIARSYIGLSREGDIDSDERALEDIQAWHIENLRKLKYVFTPEIHSALDRLYNTFAKNGWFFISQPNSYESYDGAVNRQTGQTAHACRLEHANCSVLDRKAG